MKILIFGAGAIGTIYGYLLSKAGNDVIHFVRENRAEQLKNGLDVNILDGRNEKDLKVIQDVHEMRTITDFNVCREFDMILVSIKHGSLDGVLQILKEDSISGDIVFFNGLWKDYSYIDHFIGRERYLWGYPVAGGNIDYEKGKLEGAILDHIILNETDGRNSERLNKIKKIFEDAVIKVESPKDILHWVWIHMAINAGVISTCLKYGSAPAFMNKAKALKEGILTMRETLKVIEARG
jgi:ketopantoate reductase